MFLDQSKKKVVHGVHDYTSHDIEVRKSQELRPVYAILFELTGSCFLLGRGFVFSSLTSTFNIGPSLPRVVVCYFGHRILYSGKLNKNVHDYEQQSQQSSWRREDQKRE